MSKIVKHWESPLSSLIPYMTWGGLKPELRCHWTSARHSNTCYELHIILDGTCNLSFDTVELAMKAGQAVIITPDVFHAPNNVSPVFCRFSLPFSVNRELVDAMDAVDAKGHLFFEPDRRVIALCRDILVELDSAPYMHKEYASALFSQLLILCFRNIHTTVTSEELGKKHQTPDDEIERIDHFFAMYPLERQTREELAAYLGCSQRQLNRKMQAIYGTTFQQKLMISRMDMARYLLRTTELSVNEISFRVGYADNAAFYRIFRQHTGITPAQYRKENQLAKESHCPSD